MKDILKEGPGQGAIVGLAFIVLLLAWLTFFPPAQFDAFNRIVLQNDAPAGAGNSLTVTGPPTISASYIDRVLSAANSPAYGTGQALYDYGVQYGIDPAIALAFFSHESSYGTAGIAVRTRSLGNIRCSAGYRCIDGFRAYSTWQEGYQDWYRLIKDVYVTQWGLDDVRSIVERYSPAEDGNSPTAYTLAVETAVRTWRSEQ